MKKLRINIQGMTCTSCEELVKLALENVGAKNIEVSFRWDEAVFDFPYNIAIEQAKRAILDTKYQLGIIEEVSLQEKVVSSDEEDYDFIIIGSGAAAFSAAIKAVEYGAKVAMIERGIVGGTCVNIGCVPSKTLLRAGEVNDLAKINPFTGLSTSAGEVDLASLVNQKNELVNELRNQKYINLIDEYGFELKIGRAHV